MPKPQGQPLRWTDAALDALAAVTEADQQAAVALWRLLAPPWARTLLDATLEGDTDGPNS